MSGADPIRRVDEVRAALRTGSVEALAARHAEALAGNAADLVALAALYTEFGRLDLASEVAEARGRRDEAARLAEAALDWGRAGRLWLAVDDVTRALAAYARAGDGAAEAHARLLLQVDDPRGALRRLASHPTSPLVTLCLLRLGLVEAARVRDPGMGDALAARASIEARLGARLLSGHLGAFRVDAVEADGLGYLGWRGAEPVFVRVLPDEDAFADALAVHDPPLAGVPALIEADEDRRRIVVARGGAPLATPVADVEATRRVIGRAIDVLRRAHARGLVHGALRVDDVRVLSGLVTVDGWHRRGQWSSAETRAVDPNDLTAPEVQLAVAAEPRHDAWSVARWIERLFDVAAPESDLATLGAWLETARLSPREAESPPEAPERAARYRPLGGERWHDEWLAVDVVRVPRPADPARLARLAACDLLQTVLALNATSVVLAALPPTPVATLPVDAAARLLADLDRLAAVGDRLGVAADALRATAAGPRVCIERALAGPVVDGEPLRGLAEAALSGRSRPAGQR